MKDNMKSSRRQFLKMGSAALAMIPVIAVSGNALAAQNAAMRSSMKYQGTPGPEGKQCSTCVQFVPGKSAKDMGGCKIFAGDTEIAPTAYCVAYAPLPKK